MVIDTHVCFTICLCMSPDLDGYRASNMNVEMFHDMVVFEFGRRRVQLSARLGYDVFAICFTICFATICLSI